MHVWKLYSKTEVEMNNLVNKLKIFSNGIGMQFGIYNSSALILYLSSEGIQLSNDHILKEINMDESYKYLGVLEADDVKDEIMRERMKWNILDSKDNKIITKLKPYHQNKNFRSVAVVKYGSGLNHLEEGTDIDRKNRSLLKRNKTKQDAGRLKQKWIVN